MHYRLAKNAGVLVSIATDAHRVEELSYLSFGVRQARRGWLSKSDGLNSRPLAQLRPMLAATMRRWNARCRLTCLNARPRTFFSLIVSNLRTDGERHG